MSFTFFAMNKRTVGDIARETTVLWEEEPYSTYRKEEIGQAQPQLYGTSYFFVRKTLIGQRRRPLSSRGKGDTRSVCLENSGIPS